MKRKPAYRTPRNATERIAEAKAAIARIENEMNTERDGRYGEYGRSCRDSIARWQSVIDRETKDFPITLIGDADHAAKQQETINRLLRR